MRVGEADVLALLTGPDARDVLDLALNTAGVAVTDHRVHAVQHRPGDGVTVGYRVWVSAGDADADDRVAEEYMLVSSTAGRDVPDDSPGVVRLDGPDGRLLVWRHPQDPALPALGTACVPATVEPLVPGEGPVTDLVLVGYRPLRRAVLRVERGDTTAYVKVLRPAGRGGAPDVLHRHCLLAAAGAPVPRVLASSADGLVVLERAPGIPLVDAVGADDAEGLELADLLAVLDALPDAVVDLPPRPAWSQRAKDYASAVAASGRWGDRATALGAAVRERSAVVDLGPVVATHGDFHEGQLTVRRVAGRWRVAGLLDVDTVGPGHRVDDLACLVAHALALGPAGAVVAERWENQAREVVDPAALGVRTAGVLLSLVAGAVHATGSAVSVEGLLDAAEARLDP
ncbi:phosphotransferase family protein [uncultured Phycicoccus sp.]|uniref:phosphotransferase family protein n=1 Tax=uncultured Phycicoccus sp. TaxID=661422 RepID=UPI002631679F|nr:phosphotransferase [uncultured Phycicoccus sp.]